MAIDKVLKPKKKYKLVRLGGLHDGGYLIGENSLTNTETLISFGISCWPTMPVPPATKIFLFLNIEFDIFNL